MGPMHGTDAVGRIRSGVDGVEQDTTQAKHFTRERRLARIVATATAGTVALAIGLALVPRAVLTSSIAAGVLSAASIIVGLVLLALAFKDALRGQRWYLKLLAIPVAVLLLQWVIVPAVNVGLITNAPHEHSPDAAALGLPGARDVSFRARDGVLLRGWFVPGESRAAVIVLHGSHGNRSDVLDHFRMLNDHGYSVLAYDARGHGESAGHTNALGWDGDDDLAGAIAFLRRQPTVDPRRVAAVGLSMGAEQALRAAGDGLPLRAVVADGAGASTLGDTQIVSRGLTAPIADSVTRLTMAATALISRQPEPVPLKDAVSGISAPVLLVASHRRDELALDRAYATRIGRNATVWYVANAGHTQAFRIRPEAYAATVTAFLAHALEPANQQKHVIGTGRKAVPQTSPQTGPADS
jgi:uncharacterized protein